MPLSRQGDRAAVRKHLNERSAAVAQRVRSALFADEEQSLELDPRPVGGVSVEGGQRLEIGRRARQQGINVGRSEEHASELPSLMRNSYAVFCLNKKKKK